MKNLLFIFSFFFICSKAANAQGAAYSDAGMAYSKLVLDKSSESNTFTLVGNYKVLGTQYLYGESNLGNYYGKTEKAENATINYNTYDQSLNIYPTTDKTKMYIRKVNEVDSFQILASGNSAIKENLFFINSAIVDSNTHFFCIKLASKNGVGIYKAYKSELNVVSTNYIQSELRQFDLVVEYYYTSGSKYGLQKLKVSSGGLKKAFPKADIDSFLDKYDLKINTDAVLITLISLQ